MTAWIFEDDTAIVKVCFDSHQTICTWNLFQFVTTCNRAHKNVKCVQNPLHHCNSWKITDLNSSTQFLFSRSFQSSSPSSTQSQSVNAPKMSVFAGVTNHTHSKRHRVTSFENQTSFSTWRSIPVPLLNWGQIDNWPQTEMVSLRNDNDYCDRFNWNSMKKCWKQDRIGWWWNLPFWIWPIEIAQLIIEAVNLHHQLSEAEGIVLTIMII